MIDENIINLVWSRAKIEEGFNADSIRKDPCGAWILKNQYGNRNSIFGWEIDHVFPVSKGGDDNTVNLRAMQWENNQSKGNDYPSYVVKVQAEGSKNVHKTMQFTINEHLQSHLRLIYSNAK